VTDPLLSVRDLHAGYGETRVLRGVSFDVPAGSVVSLVGRNGAGKTTTLRSVVGNVVPTAGSVVFDGEDVTGLPTEETVKRGVGYVPEDRRVFPGLTVRENLELAALGGANDATGYDVQEALDTFENLREHVDSRGATLSGGEQQMLAIARALVSGTRLLLLDEPTEGLAPFVVRAVEDVVRDLNDRGITVLLVEQNVQVALELADYHYVLDQGRVVWDGTDEDLAADDEVLDRHLGVSAGD
jgi:branched-chain amino acid transport system ATP-binding protein